MDKYTHQCGQISTSLLIKENDNKSTNSFTTIDIPHAHARGGAKVEYPTKDEVVAFCQGEGLECVNAEEFFNFYNGNDWKDEHGKPIRNWRALCKSWNKPRSSGDNPRATENEKPPSYNLDCIAPKNLGRYNAPLMKKEETAAASKTQLDGDEVKKKCGERLAVYKIDIDNAIAEYEKNGNTVNFENRAEVEAFLCFANEEWKDEPERLANVCNAVFN